MMPQNFTNKSQEALQRAAHIAAEYKGFQVEPPHLFLSLLSQDEGIVVIVLKKLSVAIEQLKVETDALIRAIPPHKGQQPESIPGQIMMGQAMIVIIQNAAKEAQQMGDTYISVEHLLLAFLKNKNPISDALSRQGVQYKDILDALKEVRGSQTVDSPSPEKKYQLLEKFGKNYTDLAKQEKLDPVIGRDDEVRRVMQVLSRRTKNNPVLIGEPGVGKTAIVEALAQRIVNGDVPESLKNKELISLEIGGLLAGTKFRGEFEERFSALLKEVIESDGEIILFIDEMHTLMGAGSSEGAVDASNMLKPALARGELRTIGATTIKEYQQHIEKDAAFERRFQPVFVDEPTKDDTIAILRGIKEKYEVHHGVRITDSSITSAVELSDRYITDRQLPDKAIDLIDEAASALRLEIESMPDDLDKMKRKMMKLEIELKALEAEQENDEAKEKMVVLKKELENIREQSNELEVHWKHEKEIITKIRDKKKQIDQLKQQAEIEERKGNLQKVAEIRFATIPDIEKDIKQFEQDLDNVQEGHAILKEEITEEDIAGVVSRWTGVPVSKMLQDEIAKLAVMEDVLAERVVGQREAIEAVSNAIRRSRAGVAEEKKPIGSFIFLGPTGVGKTELAKSLADFLFNDEEAIVRVDMSEFMEKHATSKLIGSPPGYVGYEEGGQLTERIRRRPYSVILFDEIEKAHPDIFNMMLQILDDGHLTDAKGRKVNFKNTVIIMTSNLGSEAIMDMGKKGEFGFDDENSKSTNSEENKVKEKIMETLRERFKPEFLNRVDEFIVFHPLREEQIAFIVDIQLELIKERLQLQKIQLDISDKAKKWIAKKGYDPTLGARPLKRVLQTKLLDKIAMQIIKDEVTEERKISVDVKKDDLVIA